MSSTYSLSSVYRALGMKDARVLPSIEGGVLTPVVSLGNLNSFSPEAIEARGIITYGTVNLLGGQWVAVQQQSTAPGGTVIEFVFATDNCFFSIAPVKPFAGIITTPFSTGGVAIQSLFEVSAAINVGPFPLGGLLGGSNTPSAVFSFGQATELIAGAWVPPGSFFWAVLLGADPNAYASWRFREIPQPLGSP